MDTPQMLPRMIDLNRELIDVDPRLSEPLAELLREDMVPRRSLRARRQCPCRS